MLHGEADKRELCSLLELSHPDIQQLQFENEQNNTNDSSVYLQAVALLKLKSPACVRCLISCHCPTFTGFSNKKQLSRLL